MKTYKIGDFVRFDDGVRVGVGTVISYQASDRLLVHSPSIKGHNGETFINKRQDNENNWFFNLEDLKPFTKKVGQRYTFIGDDNEFKDGETITLIELYDDICSVYANGINDTYLYDVDNDVYEPDVQYLDEGEQEFTQQDLEVGMLCETENNKWWSVNNESERDLNKNNELVVAIYKKNKNGDLIKLWERPKEKFYQLVYPKEMYHKERVLSFGDNRYFDKEPGYKYNIKQSFTKSEIESIPFSTSMFDVRELE